MLSAYSLKNTMFQGNLDLDQLVLQQLTGLDAIKMALVSKAYLHLLMTTINDFFCDQKELAMHENILSCIIGDRSEDNLKFMSIDEKSNSAWPNPITKMKAYRDICIFWIDLDNEQFVSEVNLINQSNYSCIIACKSIPDEIKNINQNQLLPIRSFIIFSNANDFHHNYIKAKIHYYKNINFCSEKCYDALYQLMKIDMIERKKISNHSSQNFFPKNNHDFLLALRHSLQNILHAETLIINSSNEIYYGNNMYKLEMIKLQSLLSSKICQTICSQNQELKKSLDVIKELFPEKENSKSLNKCLMM